MSQIGVEQEFKDEFKEECKKCEERTDCYVCYLLWKVRYNGKDM
jgi:hypothetical protein